jgi:hypothetical protein
MIRRYPSPIKTYCPARFQEKSTWIALIGLLALTGVNIEPDQSALIVNGALAAVGVAVAATKG